MKVKYEKGELRFNFWEVVAELTDAEKLELAEVVACDDSVIKFVAQQILDGWTENGSFGGKFCTAHADPGHGLDWACRQVALRAEEVARKEIERLQDALRFSEKKYSDLVAEAMERRRGYA